MVLVLLTVLGAGCERECFRIGPSGARGRSDAGIQKDVPVHGEWVGTLEGYVNAQIQPQVSGYLIRQDYHEGAFVQKGQVLFEIDPRPFQAALDQAKAQLAQAEAQLANAELNVKRDIPEAELTRFLRVNSIPTPSRSLVQRRQLRPARPRSNKLSSTWATPECVSLVDGIAGINTVQVGNLVGPSTVLTAVSQVSPIKVYFPISEQEYLRMADGGGPGSVDLITHASRIPLQLTLADGNTYPHPGKIIFADRQVNERDGNDSDRGRIHQFQKSLAPGTVRARSYANRQHHRSATGAAGGGESTARNLSSNGRRRR